MRMSSVNGSSSPSHALRPSGWKQFLAEIGLQGKLILAFSMLVAFFIVHGGDPFRDQELAMMYAAPCLVLLLTGAGRFSLDHLIFGARSRGSLKLDV